MNGLEVFANSSYHARVILIDGNAWFVAADVLAELELNRSSIALLDDEDKGVHTVDTPGGGQDMTLLSEAGLYSLILRSRKPEAKAFKRWITHVVIPEIRKTGSYGVPPQRPAVEPTRRELALMVIESEDARIAAEARVAELEPRAEIADAFLTAAGDYSVREAAQILADRHGIDLGQTRLFARLRQIGWLDRAGRPYQQHIDCGRLRSKPQTYGHPRTHERIIAKPQVRVTTKGVADLYRILAPGAGLALLVPLEES